METNRNAWRVGVTEFRSVKLTAGKFLSKTSRIYSDIIINDCKVTFSLHVVDRLSDDYNF